MRRTVVSVATCDLIRSRKYSTEQRRRVDAILRKAFKTVEPCLQGGDTHPCLV